MANLARVPSSSWQAKFDHLPVAFSDRLSDLSAALESISDAAIWSRQIPLSVKTWLDAIPAEQLPEGRYVIKPSDIAQCIARLFAKRGLAATPALTWLSEDAETQAKQVCDVARADWVRLRLETVDDNGCSKLHIDNVFARMICTYRGPGTQLGFEASGPQHIETVPTAMPVLLKGRQWPGEHEPKLRHRSPPIAGTDVTRLILVLEGASPEDLQTEYDTLYVGD